MTLSSRQSASPLLVDLVNPLVGTSRGGNTFPGATMPFGMVQPSPRTPHGTAGGDYLYEDDRICGFGTLHISGPGCAALGHVTTMLAPGNSETTEPRRPELAFDHADETATAGYYSVRLASAGRAELTASSRVAWERFTPEAECCLLIDLGRGQVPTTDAQLTVVNRHTIEGHQTNDAFGAVRGDASVTVYFCAAVSRPIVRARVWDDQGWARGSRAAGRNIGVALDTDGDEPLVVAIGISFVDAEGARRNLRADLAELGTDLPASDTFDRALARATAAWECELERVRITGATLDEARIHATALYHALLHPNICSDVDGRYLGADRRVHTVSGRPEYTTFSLWDTFRTQQPLLSLITPSRARDIMLSLVDLTRELGVAPRWVLCGVETNTMSGDSATLMFAQALAAGILESDDLVPIWPILWRDARHEPPSTCPGYGRVGAEFYWRHGWVAYRKDHPHACSSASAGLEWSQADTALAHIAITLGHGDEARQLLAQARRYHEGFDATTGFFRPRHADGTWLEPFDPEHVTAMWIDSLGYEEGSAWQYLWAAPHDLDGLQHLLGGRERMLSLLDSFFGVPDLQRDRSMAATLWQDGRHHAAWNEHDMQAPWTHAALGEPGRTNLVVRAQLENFFGTDHDGLPDNDDLGTMSAWYLLSAWGLYQYAAGQDAWLLARPHFSSVTVLPDGDPSRRLTITRMGDGAHVTGVRVNGREHTAAWVRQADLVPGTIEWRTADEAQPRETNQEPLPAFLGTLLAATAEPETDATPMAGQQPTPTQRAGR